MRTSRIVIGAAAVAVLGLTGCTAKTQGTITPPSSSPNAGTKAAPAAEEKPTVAKIGGTFTYPDGLAVTLVSLTRVTFDPDTIALDVPSNVGIKVVIKITNGTPKPVEVSLIDRNLRTGPNGVPASGVYGNGLDGFKGTIVPGRAATGIYGYSVAPAAMGLMSLDVSPGFDYKPALFEGTLR